MEKRGKTGKGTKRRGKMGKNGEKRGKTGGNGGKTGGKLGNLGLCEALRTLVLFMLFVCSLPISGLWISQSCVPKILLAMWQGHWRRR